MLFKKKSGTSIFEILVVIAVIFIIAMVSYPFLTNYSNDQDLKNSTKVLVGHLKLAQQYTVTEQDKHSIRVDLLVPTYSLFKKGSPDELISGFELDNNVFFLQTTGIQNDEAVFNPTGAVDYSGEIILKHQATGDMTKIYIKPSGYVSWGTYEE